MRALAPEWLERIVGRRVVSAEPLAGGYRNSNFKLRVDGAAEALVLRVYEHDPALCRKELDLWDLVRAAVPVPEVARAEPDAAPPYVLTRYVEGISFHELRRGGGPDAVAQAARSAGEALAAIGRFRFSRPGWIAPGPVVTKPLLEGADPLPRFIDDCLASPLLRARLGPEARRRISERVWSRAGDLAALDRDPRLAHGDFNRRNLIAREVGGEWRVAAVLDWEFAVAGSPLMDVGNFLRYDATGQVEPPFARGYLDAGGVLPPDWVELARLTDLAAICALLAAPDTPDPIVAEVAALPALRS